MPRTPGDDYQPYPIAPQAPGRPPPGAPAPAPGGPPNPFDYGGDPILARIRALLEMRLRDAEAHALRLRREAALEYGDEGLARELGLSEEDIKAARDNPFSIRAKLAEERKNAPRQLDEGLKDRNL